MSSWRTCLVVGLSMSIGWGIRGNFGHEYGAMIPGALAALALVILSGREDWWKRYGFFGMFGALGWSLGGAMSYGQVIGYTHSGHLPSVVYGFICLFVIGFLWGSLGGVGTAIPAILTRDRLLSLFGPITLVFLLWILKDLVVPLIESIQSPDFRHQSWLYWHDSDWIAALMALVATGIWRVWKKDLGWGGMLILYMALGWWMGMIILVQLLGLSMTPPRSDNWAGNLGMTIAVMVYFHRQKMQSFIRVLLISGFVGGVGFSSGVLVKLIGMKTGWVTNWWSVMEQTYGFINGIGLALCLGFLARTIPLVHDTPALPNWSKVYTVMFTLVIIPYVNIKQNVSHWVDLGAVPSELYSLSTQTWFNFGYLFLGLMVFLVIRRGLQVSLPMAPRTMLGNAQWLYLLFLWIMVAGNLMRAIPPFNQQRLITEGVIHFNAVICTLLVVYWGAEKIVEIRNGGFEGFHSFRRMVVMGLISLVMIISLQTGITRFMYGDQVAPGVKYQPRFGPDSPAAHGLDRAKPHP